MFDNEVISRIKERLVERRQTISTAESVTSGMLQLALSTAVDASHFYQGGITAYNIGQKARHLHIDPIHALNCNCVSDRMAEDMATEACRLFTSDWGIGVTGYASPIPESGDATFAFFAIASGEGIRRTGEIRFEGGSPLDAQRHYTSHILSELADLLGQQNA